MVNGSISGDATVTDSGILSGSGTIGGKLYNRNKIIAGNVAGVGNLTMGNLESSGDLIAQNENTKFVVNGTANVDGSTFKIQNAMPGETEILTANSITGNLNNSTEKISGLLSSNAKVAGNKIVADVKVTNNLGDLDSAQSQTFNAIKNISATSTDNKLRAVLNFSDETAKTALDEIGNSDAVYMLSAAQRSTVANRIISDRLSTAFLMPDSTDEVIDSQVTDSENNSVFGISATAPTPVDNNFWVKFTKNWGKLKEGAKYHGQAISGGYDRAIGKNWRAGIFVSYDATSLGATRSSGNIYDTRFGIYGGYHNDVDDAFIYIDGGKVRNKFQRSISSLGLSTDAKYNSNIFEIGGEYKRNLTPDKNYSISPYINLQYSHLKQNSYSEEGAGIFNQHVDSKSNNYFAGQLGIEYKRQFTKGNYAARIGIKHAFTGADPELNFSYEGDANNSYSLKNNQDKTHFVLSIGGENEFANGWIIGGDLSFQKGRHDRDLTASVMLRKVW